jgi:hypothetical protein
MRIAFYVSAGLPGRTAVSVLLKPDLDKGFDIVWQLLPLRGPLCLGKVAELPEQRHPAVNIASRIVVGMEPGHIALNGLADPGLADAINRVRLQKIAL